MFNPLEYNGIPLERQTRDWRELDVAPIDAESADPYATCRIIAVNSVENQAIQFDYQIARNHADSDIRREMDFLGSLSEQQHHVVDRLLPEVGSVLEQALEYEHAAVDLDSWLARGEPDPHRREVYESGALADFDHLYRYAEVSETARRRGAERVVDEVTEVLPERPGPGQAPVQEESGREPTTSSLSESSLSDLNALTLLSVEQLMRTFYRSADPDHVDPSTRSTYREISQEEQDPVARHQALIDPNASCWQQLVTHEYNECYLYYTFLQQETDPRVRAVWELYLDMELARLRLARDLLRRFEDRDADEIVGSLPEPLGFEQNRQFLRQLLATRLAPDALGSGSIREVRERLENVPATSGSGELDVIDVLMDQHERIEALFHELDVATDERRQSVWAELVDLLCAHEGAEGELVHPLARATIVGGLDVVRDLIEEERKINQMLARLIDAGVGSAGFADAVGELRDAVVAHARNEERFEFPQLREQVPAERLREMAAAARPVVPA